MEAFKVAAPTRVDLAGGTLDVWPLYNLVSEGRTINMALAMHAVALFELSASDRFQMDLQSSSGETFAMTEPVLRAQLGQVPASLRFPVAIVSEYLRQQHRVPKQGIRIVLRAEAPVGSGLGGSSTLCVAIVRGLARVFGDYFEQGWQWRMLTWVRDVEAAYLGVPTGTQDYLAALFGGLQCYRHRIGSIESFPYPDAVFQSFSERVLVLFSGEMHQSGRSNWEVFKGAMEGKAEIIQGLQAIAALAESLDDDLRRGHLDWKHIGQQLNEEWRIRRELFKVHTARLDEIMGFLAKNNVLGAKVCGAAQGGSLLVLVDPAHKHALAKLCAEKGITVLPSACARHGVAISVE